MRAEKLLSSNAGQGSVGLAAWPNWNHRPLPETRAVVSGLQGPAERQATSRAVRHCNRYWQTPRPSWTREGSVCAWSHLWRARPFLCRVFLRVRAGRVI